MIEILLCDDDVSYAEILEYKLINILQKTSDEFTITVVNNLQNLKEHILNDGADIIFLDIMIGNINSVKWVADNIRKDIQYVFMTAYPTEAYLISEIENCLFFIKTRTSDELLNSITLKSVSRIKKDSDYTIVKFENENIPVRFDDILFVESMGNYIMLNINDGKRMKIYSKLKNFSLKLPNNFLLCHKSYIINMDYVANYRNYEFTLETGTDIPIAQKKYKSVVAEYISYIENRQPKKMLTNKLKRETEDNDNGNS